MKITGRTKVIGIFGDPVEHTLSPAMHNAAFVALGLDMVYVPFHVRPGELKKAVAGIRALNMPGTNITIPHKERVIKLLDEVDEYAKETGAVNTIVNKGGRLSGYNTDGLGYLSSLTEETGFTPKGKNIIIIGAGGAARSIFYALLSKGVRSILLANRTVKRAKALADEFSVKFRGVNVEFSGLERGEIENHAQKADLVINTTSIGMMGKGTLELPFESFPGKAIISDIVYRPLKTDLIEKAEKRGLKTHPGLGMLVHQGSIGFELWTGKKAPVEVMRRAALKELNRK